MTKYRCMVKGCKRTKEKDKEHHFFTAPTSRPAIYEKWKEFAQVEKSYRQLQICSDHFELKYYRKITPPKFLLWNNAVPTIPPRCQEDLMNDESNVNGGHFEQNISPHMIQFLKPPKTEIGICEEVELIDNEDDTMEEPEVELIEDNNLKIVNDSESPISTHVTDNTTGKPISDLRVTLYQLNNGRWSHISEGVTNASGVFNKFIERADFTAGRYKLRYDVDRYFLAQKQKSRFPFIEIIFDASLMDTCHIPVFVSPHAYSAFGGT